MIADVNLFSRPLIIIHNVNLQGAITWSLLQGRHALLVAGNNLWQKPHSCQWPPSFMRHVYLQQCKSTLQSIYRPTYGPLRDYHNPTLPWQWLLTTDLQQYKATAVTCHCSSGIQVSTNWPLTAESVLNAWLDPLCYLRLFRLLQSLLILLMWLA